MEDYQSNAADSISGMPLLHPWPRFSYHHPFYWTAIFPWKAYVKQISECSTADQLPNQGLW